MIWYNKYMDVDVILQGDALEVLRMLPSESVNCCVTSPPYWGLRDYGIEGQLGLERTPEEYVERLVEVFREVRRVLRNDGTLWLNLGDSYVQREIRIRHGQHGSTLRFTGNKASEPWARGILQVGRRLQNDLEPKNLIGIPWRTAFALQADGWMLRSDIIWYKSNCLPESVKDRPTKSHEHIFLLAKNERYYYDQDAIREPHSTSASLKLRDRSKESYNKSYWGGRFSSGSRPEGHPLGRNKRDVWIVPTKPFKGAHFACFPPDLIRPCILAGCPEGGIVLDPFFGSGTTGVVAKQEGRHYIGIELNPGYIEMAKERIMREAPMDRLL